MVYTGTHDNDTMVGWWKSAGAQEAKRYAAAYMGEPKDGINWAFIRAALSSVADLALVPLQDVLGLDSDSRMNIPSRPDGNWVWRFHPDALTHELAQKLAALSTVCDRHRSVSAAAQQNQSISAEEFAA